VLYEKVFNRIFRRWTCDHDPVEYDKEVYMTSSDRNGGFYWGYSSHYVYTHTTTFYKCSFCGHKSKEMNTTGEQINHSDRMFWR